MKVVKVDESISSGLKQLCDSYVVTATRLDISEEEIANGLETHMGVAVTVKRLNHYMFWVNPLSGVASQQMVLNQ